MQRASAFTGSPAIVTGAGSGIGRGVALALGALGARVAVIDRDAAAAAAVADTIGTAKAYGIDVTDETAFRDAVADFCAETPPRFLFCAAGICLTGSAQPNRERWSRVMDVNVFGSQAAINAVWDGMAARGEGHIVLVSSIAAARGSKVAGIEYSASKGAIEAMTVHVARLGGEQGIRCNAIAPGVIETAMTASFPAANMQAIPLRRIGTVADAVAATMFLLDPASSYVTGAVLPVDGGMRLGG